MENKTGKPLPVTSSGWRIADNHLSCIEESKHVCVPISRPDIGFTELLLRIYVPSKQNKTGLRERRTIGADRQFKTEYEERSAVTKLSACNYYEGDPHNVAGRNMK